MKTIKTDTLQKVISQLEGLENLLIKRINSLEDKIQTGEELFMFFRDGINGFKDRHLKELPINPISKWHEKIRKDPELRHPHRKVMETLLAHYDYGKKEFLGVSTNNLCKEAKVGKNLIRDYASVLEKKGYVERIDQDNYRKYYKIRNGSENMDK